MNKLLAILKTIHSMEGLFEKYGTGGTDDDDLTLTGGMDDEGNFNFGDEDDDLSSDQPGGGGDGGQSRLEARTAALGFQPQKELPQNQMLPYADRLDAESKENFAKIKTNLAKTIALR